MTEHHLQLKDEIETTEKKAKAAAYNIHSEKTIDYMSKSAFAEYNKRKTVAESNMAALRGIILGQCTGSLQQHIKDEDDYDQHLFNAGWLLQTLKKVITGATNQ